MSNIITDNISIWTSALVTKKSVGRGSSKKKEAYGIKKLRELILELAVRGKLVSQDPNDEPASALLEKIVLEREKLIKEKKIKKLKQFKDIQENEKPFPIPDNWEFVRLNDIGEWGAGATPTRGNHKYYGGTIPWFKSGELNADYISQSEEHVTDLALQESSLRYNKVGDVLIAMYGATIGKTAILEVPATTNQAVCACTPFKGFENIFLLMLLRAYKHRFISMGVGGAQPNISREKIIATIIPLPSLAEQHRIVTKVDELMALCDKLEEEQEENSTTHQTLVETLLGTLTNVETPEPFSEAWQRISEHFDVLFTTEQSIDKLQETILQLAVMGKLVSQDHNDEPASILLEKITEEKEWLIKEGKIKSQELLPKIDDEFKPFELPIGWIFVRLGNIANRIGSGSTPRGGKSAYIQRGIPFLRSQNIWNYSLALHDVAYISEETHNKMSNTIVYANDILLNITGGSLGRSTIFPSDIGEANVSQHVTIIRPTEITMNSYLHLCILSPYIQKLIWDRQVGVAREGLSKKVLELFEIPLPPIEEQYRIVKKVDELMSLCNNLSVALRELQTVQVNLADTVAKQLIE